MTRKFGSAAFAGEPELAIVFLVVDEVVDIMEHLFAVPTNQGVLAEMFIVGYSLGALT